MSENMRKALKWYVNMGTIKQYELAERHKDNFIMPFGNKAILIMYRQENPTL